MHPPPHKERVIVCQILLKDDESPKDQEEEKEIGSDFSNDE